MLPSEFGVMMKHAYTALQARAGTNRRRGRPAVGMDHQSRGQGGVVRNKQASKHSNESMRALA
jgi:hypothetical protein